MNLLVLKENRRSSPQNFQAKQAFDAFGRTYENPRKKQLILQANASCSCVGAYFRMENQATQYCGMSSRKHYSTSKAPRMAILRKQKITRTIARRAQSVG
ncbi:hypothetical protein ACVITL_005161 [Rhizobium pisi]